MRGKHGVDPRQEAVGEEARPCERRVDSRLTERLLASSGQLAKLLTAPGAAWEQAEYLWDILSAAEELGVCDLAMLAGLTWRETEVLRLQLVGCRSAAIADELHIAPETAKTHMKRLRAKIAAAREERRGLGETE